MRTIWASSDIAMRPRVILSGQPLTSIAMGNGRPLLPANQSNVTFCKEEIGEGGTDEGN